jgi:tetratricopeptide (TPR) repeat protein
VNILIHLVNSVLVYTLVLLTFKTPYFSSYHETKTGFKTTNQTFIALFAALLFVSHPIQTQAVTYITQRFASLAALFYLLALVLYIKARLSVSRAGMITLYITSVTSAICAMLSKENSLTLPAVIVLYEFMFFGGAFRRRVLWLIPYVATMLIAPLAFLVAKSLLGQAGGVDSALHEFSGSMTRWDYLFTQFRVVVTYIRLLFFPVNQNFDYDFPISHTLLDLPVLLSFVFLLLLFLSAAILFFISKREVLEQRHELRIISFGILWFFITISVESSIIPLSNVIFEHRVYLPSVGFFIALVTFILLVARRMKALFPAPERAVVILLTAVVLIFSGVAYARNNLWTDRVRLWEDIVKKSPQKVRPHNFLGKYYEQQGRLEEAMEQFNIAIRLGPDDLWSRANLGAAYEKLGRFEDAKREYLAAIRVNPKFVATHNNLGVLYGKQGQMEKAMEEFDTALKLDHTFAEAHNNKGMVYERLGQFEKAAGEYRSAIASDPGFTLARHNLEVINKKMEVRKKEQ